MVSITDEEMFETACNAFGLFTLAEKFIALKTFAGLRYPKTEDRFQEAVYQVISASWKARQDAVPAVDPPPDRERP